MHDRAGKGKQLPLSRRKVVAALPHDLIKSALKPRNERIRIDIAAGIHHRLVVDAFVAERDIAADRAREQENILQHLPEMAAK